MLRYALTRLVSLALSLVVASLVVFVALEVVPGDPAGYMLGMNATPEAVAALRAELGLDAGPVERYLGWVGGMLRGDFGISYTYRTPVAGMVWRPAAGVAAAGALWRWRSRRDRLPGRDLGGGAARDGGRRRGDGGDAARRGGAELLVRDAAGAASSR